MPEPQLQHRALVVSPFPVETARGNATTALRTQHRLESRGAVVRLVTPGELQAAIADFAPHVIHGIHAGHFALALERVGPLENVDCALVLTIGGNDLYEHLDLATGSGPGAHDDAAWDLVVRADAIITNTGAQHAALVERHPRRADIFLAHKYPEVGHARVAGLDSRIGGRRPVVGWCGALRHQKRPEWLLPIHRALRTTFPDLVTLAAGPPPTDPAGAELENAMVAEPGVLRIAPFASGTAGAIGTLLGRCDLVLNTSRTEGVANFLLEALHERVPVLAARTPGNRDWIADQAWLFDSRDEAIELARKLLADETLRTELGSRGRAWLDEHADPELEADVLAAAHRRALQRR
ncbi:MAG: glycosyltransferase family 4 protein [Planctomycetota bacterium]|nr:glycosyltransferase family 4 protein [Planctomycetota bacterium]